MSQAQAAAELDRLPWLANEAEPKKTNNLREISGWLVAAVLLVGVGAYWLVEQGPRSVVAPQIPPARTTTVVLPEAQQASPKAKTIVPMHSAAVQPAQTIATHSVAAEPGKGSGTDHSDLASASIAKATRSAATDAKEEPEASSASSNAQHLANASTPSPLYARPGMQTQNGAHLVQVGAFAHVDQARLVWREMVRAYPAVTQFEPSVIENRDWNGHAFYQFQMGTASQADSEMLCQSMQRSNFRCAVVRLPWKAQQ